jgi:ATP-binding cassette subfamily B protein
VSRPKELRGKAFDWNEFRRLGPLARGQWRPLLLALFLIPLSTLAQIAQPLVVKMAIDQGIIERQEDVLLQAGLLFFGLLVFEILFRSCHLYLIQAAGARILRDLRSRMFSHTLRLSPGFFGRTPRGRLVSRLTSDVEAMSEIFGSGLVSILGDLFLIAATILTMITLSPSLAGITLILLPPLGISVSWIRIRLQIAFRKIRTLIARKTAFTAEAIAGMDIIQTYAQETRMAGEFEEVNQEERDAELAGVRHDSILSALVELSGSLSLALILWWGGLGVIQDTLTFGTVVAFIEYATRLYTPLKDLSAKYSIMQSATAASEKVFGLLEEKDRIEEPSSPTPIYPTSKGLVEIRDLHFAYRPGEPVLRDMNLTVNSGERIGLIGPTGCGKSTLLRLLVRFHDIDRGQVHLDGLDLRDYSLGELRKRIRLVSQEVVLFRGTLEDNIRIFDSQKDPERLRWAAETTGLQAVADRLPDGYQTQLGEGGSGLSFGERQLIAFTRALLDDPKVLLLDEATSAIDPRTESLLQQALSGLLEGRTAIVVAHRKATLNRVDRIVRMEASSPSS